MQGHLHHSPEDCGVEARADDRPGRPRAHAVLAVLPAHAQPVEGVRAQQRQRMRHRQAHICMNDISPQSLLLNTPSLPWQLDRASIYHTTQHSPAQHPVALALAHTASWKGLTEPTAMRNMCSDM